MTLVGDVLDALDTIAPPHLALGDDPRGLLLGDPSTPVSSLVTALDITFPVAASAQAFGAALAIAHHPLIYRPLRALRADDPFPGRVALFCARHGIAVACAHTNWDVADGGVNDVLAGLLGLVDVAPLRITSRQKLVKLVVFVPVGHRDALIEALSAAGAGALGDYDRCAYWTPGNGTFRPLAGARPFIGEVGRVETVEEERLEMFCPEARWPAAVAALRGAHPYEEPAFDIVPLANSGAIAGLGRIGRLPEPERLETFRDRIAAALGFHAVRVSGPADGRIERVAVCGGAGAELMADAQAAGAQALVTADVRHHEFVDADARGFHLVDAGHAATETPGARELARRLAAALPGVAVRFAAHDGALAAV